MKKIKNRCHIMTTHTFHKDMKKGLDSSESVGPAEENYEYGDFREGFLSFKFKILECTKWNARIRNLGHNHFANFPLLNFVFAGTVNFPVLMHLRPQIAASVKLFFFYMHNVQEISLNTIHKSVSLFVFAINFKKYSFHSQHWIKNKQTH